MEVQYTDIRLAAKPETIFFDGKRHNFEAMEGFDVGKAIEGFTSPLSVILQVTRRCNFDCAFCSEIAQMNEPNLEELDLMRRNLQGTQRVFLSGGEPLIRKDFADIADMFSKDFIVGLPTNATPAAVVAKKLVGKVAFVNIGLDGPRAITNRVRGDFDKVLRGIYRFKEVGLPLSFSAVALRSTLSGLPYLYQIADILEAGKLKLILPIRKGNGLFLADSEFISEEEAGNLFRDLLELRKQFDWRPALRMTTWTPQNEGYSILIYPNGKTYAWPVYDAEDKVEYLGDITQMTIQEIWKKYRFKRNHLTKYLGKSIRTAK